MKMIAVNAHTKKNVTNTRTSTGKKNKAVRAALNSPSSPERPAEMPGLEQKQNLKGGRNYDN